MNIILLLELGYYQMNTIFGIPMLQINQKKIHVLIFLNQIMVRWDMGNVLFVSFFFIDCLNISLIEFKFFVIMKEFNPWIIILFKNIFVNLI